ncbi:MAG: hypothetical protein CVU00_01980 [Bacteroidetes bacterium HGW-Bacteroidetes-17]|nr:MAG: hypothetical protein CVU00_01980 [Bacteroidetes bacterium HGW-Bacteroidetes-17]
MNRLNLIGVLMISVMISSCSQQGKTIVEYVNPFIGTDGHGHTYPGAALPFGMVQLSPDTRKDNWDACSGYHYSDSTIMGFSHTHLSGTGVGDYGDIRLMPTVGEVQLFPGEEKNPSSGYRSSFSHKSETASPGFYSVHLDEYDIKVELTVDERFGFHKYIFPEINQANVIIDLTEAVTSDKINDLGIKILDHKSIVGYRKTQGWAKDQQIYFYLEFSKEFKNFGILSEGLSINDLNKEITSKNLKAFVQFATQKDEAVYVKVGISAVSSENAKLNLGENTEWNFENIRMNAQNAWLDQLSRIQIKGGTDAQKTTFYTALYHSLLNPNLFSDINGEYRGHDGEKHKGEYKMYTVFSLWDTFRAAHPLFTMIEQKRTNEFIVSMLDMYDKGGLLPVWELAGNETNCMIGYHAISVIYDAYKKGIRDYDVEKALAAMVASAHADQFGLKFLREEGYIPAGKEGESVSKTLEYAYDDWCIAMMAKDLGKEDIYLEFIERAQFYKNIFDKETGFMRGKINGAFVSPFDPTQVNFMLTEANTWQYNFFVPHDVNGLINLLGGKNQFEAKLDELFNTSEGLSGRQQSDITGLIGQYAHGNEPSHHMAYLYDYIGAPAKGAKVLRKIMDELYTDQPSGLCGNEDCGQMSAWYVLSALGFYPVCPGDNQYIIGTPLFDEISINLENGKKLTIKSENLSKENSYIQAIKYNGVDYSKSYFTHEMLMEGGEFVYMMGSTPSDWGTKAEDCPTSSITEHLISPVPYFKSESRTFTEKLVVELASINPETEIFYSTNGKDPDQTSKKYTDPIIISKSTSFKAIAYLNGIPSKVANAEYNKIQGGRKVSVKNAFSAQYTAGGEQALLDFIRGGENFRTGAWQGYYGVDFEAVVDLGESQQISGLSAGFHQEQNSWIWMPLYVEFFTSDDGQQYRKISRIENDVDPKIDGGVVKEFGVNYVNKKARYIKVLAKNIEVCPDWHVGAGNKAWIFVDEITIR